MKDKKNQFINKFQYLLENNNINLYPDDKLKKIGFYLNKKYLKNIFFSSLITASNKHLISRIEANEKKVNKNNQVINYIIDITTEALFDSNFRKQIHYGPTKNEVAIKVKNAYNQNEPIILVGLMFTRKNICPLKTGLGDESDIDFAEIASLIHLNNFARLISYFYPKGCRFIILSEGTRFLKAFDLCYPLVKLYQKKLKNIVKKFNLNHIKIYDYEDFLSTHLDTKIKEQRIENYKKAKKIYEERMIPIFNPYNFEKTIKFAIKADPIKDPKNPKNNFVPLWESIKNSLPYPEISIIAQEKGISYTNLYRNVMQNLFNIRKDPVLEKLRIYVLKRSWEKAIEHNAQVLGDTLTKLDPAKLLSTNAFRTSINPKPGSHLGILCTKETTSRVQPWHGKAYVKADGIGRISTTILTRLEIEGVYNGLPVFAEDYDKTPFLYADEKIYSKLLNQSEIEFNMATR